MTEPSTADYMSERVKHLEMIQDVVARMAATSAAMKRYCILTVAVGVAVLRTLDDADAIAGLIVLVVVFWGSMRDTCSKSAGSAISMIRCESSLRTGVLITESHRMRSCGAA